MNMNDGRVVSNFIVQALKSEDITIYGDGTQTRSFCYVDDLIDVIIKLMSTKKGITGPFNIGNPKEFTMIELAELVISLTNSKSKISFKELPSDDPKQRQPDINLAKEKLNWEPKTQLKDGLLKTINYFEMILAK
jgi:UDP-glucuronate decarboxylase